MVATTAIIRRGLADLNRQSRVLWQRVEDRAAQAAEPTEPDEDERRREDARSSLRAFVARMHRNYQTAAHIDRLIEALIWAALTPNARLIVTAPPRHSKSLHVSEHLPAWYLGTFPDNRVIGASHTQHLANRFSRRVRNKIAHASFPFRDVRIASDSAAVAAWDLEGTAGGYFAVGVGGSPAGTGANLIIIDDPIKNAAKAESELARDALWEWYREDIRTRLEPGGSIVVTATRWHEDDLTGRLLEAQKTDGEQWRHLHLPAIDDDGNALWPERWPAESLLKLKGAVGTRVWEAQYQGNPTPTQGGTFKRDWWQRYRVLPPLERVETYVDSAFKDGVGNDWSVFATWGTDGLGNYYLIDVWRARVQYPDLIRAGHDVHAKHEHQTLVVPLVVEDKASGQSAIQTWSRPLPTASGATLPALPVIPFPVAAGESKQARAEGVSPLVEARRVFLPETADWVDDFVEEHARFPLGKHDDQVDTTSMALSRLSDGTTGFEDVPQELQDVLAGLGV